MGANAEQTLAIQSNSSTILCLAGAGAGKSFTLVHRIGRLVESGVKPWEILALTFTNAAAFEMSEKYKHAFPKATHIPEFRTFHGFCYALLIKSADVRAALGYSKVPEVCSDSEYKRLSTETKLQLKISLSDDILSRSKSALNAKDAHQYDLYHKGMLRTLNQHNLITFDILNSKVSELFANDDPSIQRFKAQYKHILVDEFQDTDDCQMNFLKSFGKTSSFFFVADALQNLYSFRGTSNRYVKQLSNAPGWEVIKLTKNYRSTRQICEYANRMSTYAKDDYRIVMEGQRDGDDVEVFYGACADFRDLIDPRHMQKVIQKLKQSDEDSAILCRSNKEVQYACDQLTDAGIDYNTSNHNMTDDLDIIKSVKDNEYMMDWLSTLLDKDKYANYIRSKAQDDIPHTIEWFITNYGTGSKVKTKVSKIMKLRQLALSDNDMPTKLAEASKLIKTKLDMNKLAELPYGSDFLTVLETNIQDKADKQVYVGTIHSSKGLEYGHVYLMGVGDKYFELDGEDMLNLYYVGITRAKNHLTIFKA